MSTGVACVEVVAAGLGKSYGGRRVVDDASWSAPAGAVTAILGNNGAGKSTTLRLVLGFVSGSGRTTFGGKELREVKDAAETVGAFLGLPAFNKNRSARDHLRVIASLSGQGRERVDEVLELVGLAPWASARPGGFSTGMRQRLGIAGAILTDPAVWILDEPVNGLDPEAVIAVRDLIRGHARRGGTVIIASHLLAEVELIADHVVVMSHGRVVRQGTVSQLLERDEHAVIVVECDDPDTLAALARRHGGAATRTTVTGIEVTGLGARAIAELARDGGVLVWRLHPRPRTLEDAFLATVGPHPSHHASDREELHHVAS